MQRSAERSALLQEVRQDLDRALKIGGEGRYTDQTLGSFKLGVLIGRGGMGEVYDAVHVESGEPAAVKLLHPNALDNRTHVERFLREAKIAGALQLPNVVRVLEHSHPDDPLPYLAMELLRGHDLAHQLRKHGRLSLQEIVELVSQIGGVIDAAREHGIVHRDLKPRNLFVTKQADGNALWKVLDFGISKLGDNTGTLTQGALVGTPAYMAPEQATGMGVDYRADLYALSAIVYRCCTGRAPFSGKDVPVIVHNVVYERPIRPSDLANLSQDMDRVLAIGLSKQPRKRFQSGAELTEALEAAAKNELDPRLRHRADNLPERPWAAIG
jgi:serine/threonine-protein kinase